jgi:phytoene dehydrogenase-like protein
VLVLEARDTIGGGMRSAELTLPGFVHDVCSAIHPLGATSPFFRALPLNEYGLEFVHPDAPLAHPLDDGRCAVLERSLDATAAALGDDADAYRKLLAPLARDPAPLFDELLAPFHLPKQPFRMAAFGWRAIRSCTGLARDRFKGDLARALFAGNAAHSILPLEKPLTAAVGLVLMLSGHAFGWPVARGGTRAIAAALDGYFRSLGGEVRTSHPVSTMKDLPPARAYLFDVAPRHLARIAGDQLPSQFANRLTRYRHGPAAFKLDWALSQPIPWTNPACLRAATVHVGGTIEEIAESERLAWTDSPSDRPFVLVGQQSLFDRSRAPGERQQTGWAYCHVPNGYAGDMTERIEAQVERFAPGFRNTILARHVIRPMEFETYNANYVGGDITGGVQDALQLFTRPTMRLNPYTTPNPSIYICSASTPPGAGVHGMCGFHAANAALRGALR